ncbi:hypothetical protein BDY24DRAFT_380722 [Mrakia frigida]|uniref:uncharacterized protein n=1 Tax=Mrakia frigida TaxID=29902 RepID=UPI003FCC17C8
MYDVSGVSGGLGLAEDEEDKDEDQAEQEPPAPIVPAQIVVDTVESPPRTTARLTRSRSAVSADPPQKNGASSSVVARTLPSLRVEGAEAVPHLEIVPRKSSSSSRRKSKSKSGSPSIRLEGSEKEVVQVVRSVSNTASGFLSSISSVASQAIDAISSPRKSFRTAASRSPAHPQPRVRNLASGSPSPSSSRTDASEGLVGSSSSSKPNGRPTPSAQAQPPPPPNPQVNIVPPPPPPREPTPVLSAAEKKRKQEAAMAWSLAAGQRWNIPVLAAVQVLRQAGGNFEVAEEKLREEQEQVHEWTKEEDEIVLRGSAQETKALQAKVGPMVFIARLTQLRS